MKVRTLVSAALVVVGLLGFSSPAAFAQERRASVSGTVYFDANANGRPDSQERAVRNLDIELVWPDPTYKQTKKTSDDGKYEFNNLAGGRYEIFVKLPEGYGLSSGTEGELIVEDRTAVTRFDFGVAKAEQLPPPTPTATPTFTPGLAPTSIPTLPPIATRVPTLAPTQPPAVPTPEPAPQVRQSAPAPAPAGASVGSQQASSAAPAATSTPQPAATTEPQPTATAPPAPTNTPTPTRTPPPVEGQQAEAERARASIGAPGAPHTNSFKSGDEVLLDAPFRTAWDGSEYADSNSGAAALGMAMEAYGFNVSTAELRSLANTLSRTYDVGQPPRIDTLVRVGELAGLRGLGLFQGARMAVWSAESVKEMLRSGYPVVTQLRPAEGGGDQIPGDRFVLIIGMRDGNFIYHDPTFSDGRGAGRILPQADLSRAWAEGSASAQAAALALGRAELGLFAPIEKIQQAQQQPDAFADVAEVPARAPQQSTAPESAESTELAVVTSDSPGQSVSITIDPPSGPGGPWPLHPLLLAFWVVAGVVLVKVVSSFITD